MHPNQKSQQVYGLSRRTSEASGGARVGLAKHCFDRLSQDRGMPRYYEVPSRGREHFERSELVTRDTEMNARSRASLRSDYCGKKFELFLVNTANGFCVIGCDRILLT